MYKTTPGANGSVLLITKNAVDLFYGANNIS